MIAWDDRLLDELPSAGKMKPRIRKFRARRGRARHRVAVATEGRNARLARAREEMQRRVAQIRNEKR